MNASKVFLASVCLERNRWAEVNSPTIFVSEWFPRIEADGFDGIELWQYHYTAADSVEQEALLSRRLMLPIFNSYCGFEEGSGNERDVVRQAILQLKPRAVKFNFGANENMLREYEEVFCSWAESLPRELTFLCECHGGTVLETPQRAKRLLKRFPKLDIGVIVHGFSIGDSELQGWFDECGTAVRHIHISARRKGLFRTPKQVADRMALIRNFGFKGTFSIEFAEGAGQAGEQQETVYTNAKQDLQLLRKLMEQA